MKKIRYGLIGLVLLSGLATSATASVSIGIGVNLPSVHIGVNLPVFPQLVPVPGYPVYYAPSMQANYFFYDGMYWVYQNDDWYASSWYNGPWDFVEPMYVPLFVLRIPVAYYRDRPASFRGWHSNAPPRWNQRWGHEWEQRRSGWDRWERNSVPARAPRPEYQRKYSGDHYPRIEQQQKLRSQNYRYQPRNTVVREHYKQKENYREQGRQEDQKQKPRDDRNSQGKKEEKRQNHKDDDRGRGHRD
ncbi:MAG: hypothetical protein IBX46_02025 [Desulfuromonadales bacterium]|nr:hypothetical protein [Desulfuromonadales bacterium]